MNVVVIDREGHMNKKMGFLIFLFIFFGSISVFAEGATVTNGGNIPVTVQYKGGNSDYQDMTLKPGETKELPGGVEKVKVVREPGQWASPKKPGEEIKVTVKEEGKEVGTAGWYGDKVFFSSPTGSPQSSQNIIPDTPSKTPENTQTPNSQMSSQKIDVKPETGSAIPTPTLGGTTTTVGPQPEKGIIKNNGYLPMHIVFHGVYGEQAEQTVKIFESIEIPEGATGVSITEPWVFSGYTAGKKAVDVEITKPTGETTTIEHIPFRESAEIDLGGPKKSIQLNYNWKLDYKPSLKLGNKFGDDLGYKDFKKDKKDPDAREMDLEAGGGRHDARYQF